MLFLHQQIVELYLRDTKRHTHTQIIKPIGRVKIMETFKELIRFAILTKGRF